MDSRVPAHAQPDALTFSGGAVARYLEASLAPATRRAYTAGLNDFRAWCEAQGVSPLPATPEDVARYLAGLADMGRSVSTIEQRVAAVRWAHGRRRRCRGCRSAR